MALYPRELRVFSEAGGYLGLGSGFPDRQLRASFQEERQVTNPIIITAELTPEQALELSRNLAAEAHRVIENNKTLPDAYCYVRQAALWDNFLRLRIGT